MGTLKAVTKKSPGAPLATSQARAPPSAPSPARGCLPFVSQVELPTSMSSQHPEASLRSSHDGY